METNRKGETIADIVILVCSIVSGICIYRMEWDKKWSFVLFLLIAMFIIVAFIDLYCLWKGDKKDKKVKKQKEQAKKAVKFAGIERLILLDEKEKPIKSWDMIGRTALVIGKTGSEEEVDVDLIDCEYSSFIDFQHATLNFCLDNWYVEDLESHNGVRIRKVEDGQCYKIMGRPCRVSAGDILYIANTRLLLS